MADVSSSRRYAQALMDLATEHGDLDVWRRDLALLEQIWADPGIRGYLDDVRLSKDKRLARVRQTLDTRISPLALNLVLLLVSRGRANLLPYIVRQFDDLLRQQERTILAHVTSVQPLSSEERAALIAHLQGSSGREVSLEEAIDPAIIGGLVIKVGDQLLDLSVAGRLRRLREQVVGRTVAARG